MHEMKILQDVKSYKQKFDNNNFKNITQRIKEKEEAVLRLICHDKDRVSKTKMKEQ